MNDNESSSKVARLHALLVVLSHVPSCSLSLPGSMLCVGVNCKRVLVTVTVTVGVS